MNDKQIFQKYYKRLAKEGIIKSLIFGAISAFAVNFVVALVLWFVDIKGLWISVGAFAVVFAATTPVFYFRLFRPTSKKIAKRIDRLGLEERLITMMELQNDDSYIAMRQREDAQEKLRSVPQKRIRLAISRVSVVALIIVGVLGCSMTIVLRGSDEGVIPGGAEVIENFKPEEFYVVRYLVAGITEDGEIEEGLGGIIEGDEEQLVLVGDSSLPVVAVADEDWAFGGWLVGDWIFDYLYFDIDFESTDPERSDVAVVLEEELEIAKTLRGKTTDEIWNEISSGIIDFDLLDAYLAYTDPSGSGGRVSYDEDGNVVITYTALFGTLSTGSGDGEGDGVGDPDAPPSDSDNPGSNENENEKPQPPGDSSQNDNQNDSSGEGDEAGSSKYQDSTQVIDGNQYYRERYEEYYKLYLQMLENGEEIPEYLRKIIEAYFGIIE